MTQTMMAAGLFGLVVVQTIGILYLRYLNNKKMFADNKNLTPIRTSNPVYSPFGGLYRFLDSIPFLRRSGTGNEFDFLKAALITVVPLLALEIAVQQPGWFVSLMAASVMLFLINCILMAHPLLKRMGKR